MDSEKRGILDTGFIVSKEQTELITEFCREKSSEGVIIFTDPIMGDEGKLYNGVSQETVALMRKLISVSDYTVPNYTEAAYLAGCDCHEEGTSEAELKMIIDELRKLGAKSVVITSAKIKDSDCKCVFGYDDKTKAYFKIDFEEIPVRFPGTGDIFSAVFMGKILDGCSLYDATRHAMTSVKNMIRRNVQNADKYKGIPIETCLEEID